MTDNNPVLEGLALLRSPFPAHQISRLPKSTKAQTDALKAAMDKKDFSLGIRCKECGQWHHKDVVHLDYVGHAALTHRLLDCDPAWNWEPVGFHANGLPIMDGGMWIKLTVCGVTRLGYGHADSKTGGDAIKEVIGDALRNAAMRFGAALDLWHKGDLYGDDDPAVDTRAADVDAPHEKAVSNACATLESADSITDLQFVWASIAKPVQADPRVIKAKDAAKAALVKA